MSELENGVGGELSKDGVEGPSSIRVQLRSWKLQLGPNSVEVSSEFSHEFLTSWARVGQP